MNYLQNEANPARRFGGLSFVVLMHVLLAYALLTGLARQVVNIINQPIETKIIDETKPPPPEETPPEPPKMTAPVLPFIPPPEVQVQKPQTSDTITQVTTVQPPQEQFFKTAPPVALNAARPTVPIPAPQPPVPAFMDLNSCKPEYPRASLLSEEEGTVRVRFTIGTAGQLVSATVLKSSGYRNLDNATVRGLSLCKFKPAYQNGKPVQSSFLSDYVWSLADSSG